MKRRLATAVSIAVPAVLLAPAVADACGGLVGENGTIQLVRTTTLAAYSDGVERYVTAFEFTGEGESVGSIVPLPDVPTKVERGGDWTLQRLAQEVTPPPDERQVPRRPPPPPGGRRDHPRDRDRRPRHHRAQGRRRRGREVGAGERLPPHARRPRGPRLLRRAQPGVHGRQVRRHAGGRARPGRRRQHADHGDDPDRRPVGADQHPPARPGGRPAGRGRRVPAHRRASRAARRRPGADARAQRSGVGPRCSPICARTSGWSGCPRTCGSPTSSSTPTPRTSTTTWPCRSPPTTSRRSWTPGSGPASAVPVRPDRAGHAAVAAARRRLGRAGRAWLPSRSDRGGAGWRRHEAARSASRSSPPRRWSRPLAGYAVADRGGTPAAPALGPEPVTVVVDVEHSRFVPDYIRVVEGTEVRFVLRNGDPINHELIVGPDSVHARHHNGTEAYHPPKPGELSVGPDEQGVTSYVFDDSGDGGDGLPPSGPLRLRDAGRGRSRRGRRLTAFLQRSGPGRHAERVSGVAATSWLPIRARRLADLGRADHLDEVAPSGELLGDPVRVPGADLDLDPAVGELVAHT